ncbi:Endonuclease/exonuclease/phosphatase superfamily [Sesbania bispinosa]|nr:Endonuclease/exonuclease/phosphatase superfamily [Sesbania bispinosa]
MSSLQDSVEHHLSAISLKLKKGDDPCQRSSKKVKTKDSCEAAMETFEHSKDVDLVDAQPESPSVLSYREKLLQLSNPAMQTPPSPSPISSEEYPELAGEKSVIQQENEGQPHSNMEEDHPVVPQNVSSSVSPINNTFGSCMMTKKWKRPKKITKGQGPQALVNNPASVPNPGSRFFILMDAQDKENENLPPAHNVISFSRPISFGSRVRNTLGGNPQTKNKSHVQKAGPKSQPKLKVKAIGDTSPPKAGLSPSPDAIKGNCSSEEHIDHDLIFQMMRQIQSQMKEEEEGSHSDKEMHKDGANGHQALLETHVQGSYAPMIPRKLGFSSIDIVETTDFASAPRLPLDALCGKILSVLMIRILGVIQSCDLLDGGFSGDPFTWKRGQLKQRLCRVLFNLEWHVLFVDANVAHLPYFGSDHCPLLLRKIGIMVFIFLRTYTTFKVLCKLGQYPALSNEHVTRQARDVTNEEICAALFNMHGYKAPGSFS